jgi:hypothetical protein
LLSTLDTVVMETPSSPAIRFIVVVDAIADSRSIQLPGPDAPRALTTAAGAVAAAVVVTPGLLLGFSVKVH